MLQFKYEEVALGDLSAKALRQEAQGAAGAKSYRITVFDEAGAPEPEPAEAVLLEGKVGFAWGPDVFWAVSGGNIYEDVNIWLNDEEEWEGRELP